MSDQPVDTRICPRCGQPNQCAVVTGNTDCWCRQVPLLQTTLSAGETKTAATAAVCYCPACLTELTAAGNSQQGTEAQQYKAEGSA